MKILITSDLFTVETNGVVTSLKNLMDALEKRGHEVRVLTLSEKYKSHREGKVTFVRSLPIKVYNGTRMSFAKKHKLIRDIIEWKPDVIHTQCEFFTFRFAKYISKKTGAPIVHTYHTMYEDYVGYIFFIECIGRLIARAATRFIFDRVDALIVPTEKVRESHLKNGINYEFNVIPSGIDLERYKVRISQIEREEIRRELGIPEDATVLLNLGRIAKEKNIHELIELFPRVLEKEPQAVLLIVGGGPEKEALERQAAELGLVGRVVFAGMVKPDDVYKYYQIGDLFVSASTSETQGLTYIEAAANRLPLVCRRDPCLKGVIIEGENGYEYDTDEDFIAAVEGFIRSKEALTIAGKRSAEIVRVYDKSVFAERVEKIYETVLDAKAVAREERANGKA